MTTDSETRKGISTVIPGPGVVLPSGVVLVMPALLVAAAALLDAHTDEPLREPAHALAAVLRKAANSGAH